MLGIADEDELVGGNGAGTTKAPLNRNCPSSRFCIWTLSTLTWFGNNGLRWCAGVASNYWDSSTSVLSVGTVESEDCIVLIEVVVIAESELLELESYPWAMPFSKALSATAAAAAVLATAMASSIRWMKRRLVQRILSSVRQQPQKIGKSCNFFIYLRPVYMWTSKLENDLQFISSYFLSRYNCIISRLYKQRGPTENMV